MFRYFSLVIGLSVLVALMAPARRHAPAVSTEAAVIQAEDSPATVVPVSSSNGELVLNRGPSGHFETDASVNGQSLPFVVDTGADVVALTIEDARRAGLYVDPTSFKVIAEGASGPVRGQDIMLDRIEVNGHIVEHVRAAVLEGLGRNLLGQSVLTQLGGVEMTGDKMVLR